ncbi:MAG: 3-dehydroquinate synthase [Planctomycetes bacterium]|nr:3-dehydroquinate synthase [Planctomycetota bacterium]
MKELRVTIPKVEKSSYNVFIGSRVLPKLRSKLDDNFPAQNRFIITDSNVVKSGHLEKLLASNSVPTFVIDPPGETSKNINTVIAIIEAMEKASLGRDSLIVALGGGTVGDIAGFAAAIFKRGVPVVQIPTTTVSQADSAIGGKTGVDSTMSKNAFGAFHQPGAVFVDTDTLKTLDDRQFRSGLVESVKHALIADADYFDYLEKNLDAILSRDNSVLEKVMYQNCKIKAAVVQIDPLEKNKRRILNYGHTIGHAIESVSGFEILHGEAVAIGIIGAGHIEIRLGTGNSDRLDRVKNMLSKLGMSLNIPKTLAKNQLIDIMKRDKKAVNKWPRFVLIDKIGIARCSGTDGQWAHEVSQELIESVLDTLCERK